MLYDIVIYYYSMNLVLSYLAFVVVALLVFGKITNTFNLEILGNVFLSWLAVLVFGNIVTQES